MPVTPDVETFQIHEGTSGIFTALLTDNDGVTVVPGSVLLTLTLTLYVIKQNGQDQIVNGRDQQSVLNTNNVQVLDTPLTDSTGRRYNLIWSIQPGDTAIIESALRYERHIALFQWTAPNNTSGNAEVILNVKNLRRVG